MAEASEKSASGELRETVECFEAGEKMWQEAYAAAFKEESLRTNYSKDCSPQHFLPYLGVRVSGDSASVLIPSRFYESPPFQDYVTVPDITVFQEKPTSQIIIDCEEGNVHEAIVVLALLWTRGIISGTNVMGRIRDIAANPELMAEMSLGDRIPGLPLVRIVGSKFDSQDLYLLESIAKKNGIRLLFEQDEYKDLRVERRLAINRQVGDAREGVIDVKVTRTDYEQGEKVDVVCQVPHLMRRILIFDDDPRRRCAFVPPVVLALEAATERWRDASGVGIRKETDLEHQLKAAAVVGLLAQLSNIDRKCRFTQGEGLNMWMFRHKLETLAGAIPNWEQYLRILWYLALFHDYGEAVSPWGDVYLGGNSQKELKQVVIGWEELAYRVAARNGLILPVDDEDEETTVWTLFDGPVANLAREQLLVRHLAKAVDGFVGTVVALRLFREEMNRAVEDRVTEATECEGGFWGFHRSVQRLSEMLTDECQRRLLEGRQRIGLSTWVKEIWGWEGKRGKSDFQKAGGSLNWNQLGQLANLVAGYPFQDYDSNARIEIHDTDEHIRWNTVQELVGKTERDLRHEKLAQIRAIICNIQGYWKTLLDGADTIALQGMRGVSRATTMEWSKYLGFPGPWVLEALFRRDRILYELVRFVGQLRESSCDGCDADSGQTVMRQEGVEGLSMFFMVMMKCCGVLTPTNYVAVVGLYDMHLDSLIKYSDWVLNRARSDASKRNRKASEA